MPREKLVGGTQKGEIGDGGKEKGEGVFEDKVKSSGMEVEVEVEEGREGVVNGDDESKGEVSFFFLVLTLG